jgi:Flp pilus assembly protein TadG
VRLRSRSDRGSVLMLMPAGILVVIILAAISVDQSLVFLRQRQASSVAIDVANDLATAALDEDSFRSTGRFRLDEARARSLGQLLVASSDIGPHLRDVDIWLSADDEVVVELTAGVDYIFARALPGASDGTTVRARAAAVAASGP